MCGSYLSSCHYQIWQRSRSVYSSCRNVVLGQYKSLQVSRQLSAGLFTVCIISDYVEVYQHFKLVLLDPLCDNPPSAVDPWPSQHAAAATAEPGLASLRGCVHSRGVDEISWSFQNVLRRLGPLSWWKFLLRILWKLPWNFVDTFSPEAARPSGS